MSNTNNNNTPNNTGSEKRKVKSHHHQQEPKEKKRKQQESSSSTSFTTTVNDHLVHDYNTVHYYPQHNDDCLNTKNQSSSSFPTTFTAKTTPTTKDIEEKKNNRQQQEFLAKNKNKEITEFKILDIDSIEEIFSFSNFGYCNFPLLSYFRKKRKLYKNLTFLKECFGKKNNKIINIFKHWKINENLSIKNFLETQSVNPFTKSESLKINDFATFEYIVNKTLQFTRMITLRVQEIRPDFNFKLLNREKFPKLEKLMMAANDESYKEVEIISGLKSLQLQNVNIFTNNYSFHLKNLQPNFPNLHEHLQENQTQNTHTLQNVQGLQNTQNLQNTQGLQNSLQENTQNSEKIKEAYGKLKEIVLSHTLQDVTSITIMNLYCPQLQDVTIFTNKEILQTEALEKLFDKVTKFTIIHCDDQIKYLNNFIFKNKRNLHKLQQVKISALIYGNFLQEIRFISSFVTEMFVYEILPETIEELQNFTKLLALKITNCSTLIGFSKLPRSITTINFNSHPPNRDYNELFSLQNLKSIIFEESPDLYQFLINLPNIEKLTLHSCSKENLEVLANSRRNEHLRKVDLTFNDSDAEFVDLDGLLMNKKITKIRLNCNIQLQISDTQSNIPNGFPDIHSLLCEDTSHLDYLQCLINAYYDDVQ
ncbi:hypothetical protein ABK040_004229 [Willaertia magna]